MKAVFEFIKEVYDLQVIAIFVATFIYVLLADIPKYRKEKLSREAGSFAILTWIHLAVFTSFIFLVLFF